MKTHQIRALSFWSLISLLACLGFACPSIRAQDTTVASNSSFHAPKNYYLALGDSAAFGLQSDKFNDELKAGTYSPADFPGYVDALAGRINEIDPGIKAVNMSCPGYGGTSAGFLDYCRWHVLLGHDLHYNYTGSQLSAATDFLQAHPGEVSPITLGIGLGDVLSLFSSCKNKSDCIYEGLNSLLFGTPTSAGFKQNLTVILKSLRASAPDAEILLMLNYNPSAFKYPSTNDAVLKVNDVIATVGSSIGARLVDMFPSFNQTILGPQPDTLCTLLAVCPPTFDVHPTDYGYQVMADIFWEDSGYSKAAAGRNSGNETVTGSPVPDLVSSGITALNSSVALASLSVFPTRVFGPLPSTGTVGLTSPAPAGGVVVSLGSDNLMARVPSTVIVPGGATSAQFNISTSRSFWGAETANISATYNGATITAQLVVTCGSPAHRCD